MTSEANILLITRDDETVKAVKTALTHSEGIVLAGVCQDVSELKTHLSNENVQAVVVDIDLDPSRVLYDLGEILGSYTEIYVVVICSSFHKEFVLQAMQAGARNFLEKQNIESGLFEVLKKLVDSHHRKKTASDSSLISIFSAGGGCGATMICVNLASELRLLSSKPVLVMDLDQYYGTVSTYLGIKSQFGIADVLSHTSRIDKHLIQSSAYSYKDDFHVLASPASIESPRVTSLRYENLKSVLEACRQAYRYTVIDAPRIVEPVVTDLAGLSDVILVAFQLTVKDVNFARSLVSKLTQSGIAHDKIIPVANRVKKRGPLVRLEDSKKAVGLSCCQTIRSDWRKAMKSVNHGQPLAQAARISGIRNDFRKLAAYISSYGPKNGKITKGDKK